MNTVTLSALAWAMISAATVSPSVDLRFAALAGEQDVAQGDPVAGLAGELLDDDLVSGATRYCLPPVRTIANIGFSSSRIPFPARARALKALLARESEPPMAGGAGKVSTAPAR